MSAVSEPLLPEPTWNRFGGLVGSIVPQAELDAATQNAMYGVLDRSFASHPRDIFEADLASKDIVVLMRTETGEIKGFSTLTVSQEEVDGQPMGVLYSGDTIVDSDAWGSMVLQRCWLRAAWDAAEQVEGPLYWLLICSGYRTYRYLPVFWQQFWPRFDRPTPAHEQTLLTTLAERRFGDRVSDGIVHLAGGFLKEGISTIDDGRRRNPHVAFFERTNPGHPRGDELVCLCPLHPGNLTRAGQKVHKAIS